MQNFKKGVDFLGMYSKCKKKRWKLPMSMSSKFEKGMNIFWACTRIWIFVYTWFKWKGGANAASYPWPDLKLLLKKIYKNFIKKRNRVCILTYFLSLPWIWTRSEIRDLEIWRQLQFPILSTLFCRQQSMQYTSL